METHWQVHFVDARQNQRWCLVPGPGFAITNLVPEDEISESPNAFHFIFRKTPLLVGVESIEMDDEAGWNASTMNAV